MSLRFALLRASRITSLRRTTGMQAVRLAHTARAKIESGSNVGLWLGAGAAGVAALSLWIARQDEKKAVPLMSSDGDVNWDAVRTDIAALLNDEKYDDGSYGPLLVRLAWHSCGNFDKACHSSGGKNCGGSNGATMRFSPEKDFPGNAGLDKARKLVEKIKTKHPNASYADIWTFAGAVAVEEMGGPKIPWFPGRVDFSDATRCPADGLPDASQGAAHLRSVFYRMGFNDRDIVALSGAHTMGRCHTDRSGFEGPWTKAPTMFSNEFFRELVENTWTVRQWKGPLQYTDPSGTLMMLPTDMCLKEDPEFNKYVQIYAKDEQAFFNDFSAAFGKLLALGVEKKK